MLKNYSISGGYRKINYDPMDNTRTRYINENHITYTLLTQYRKFFMKVPQKVTNNPRNTVATKLLMKTVHDYLNQHDILHNILITLCNNDMIKGQNTSPVLPHCLLYE